MVSWLTKRYRRSAVHGCPSQSPDVEGLCPKECPMWIAEGMQWIPSMPFQCHLWRLLVYSIYSLFIIVLQWDNRHNMIEYLMIHAQRWIYWLSEYQISSSGIYHESMNPLAISSACSSGTVCETRCSCVVSWVKLSELRHQSVEKKSKVLLRNGNLGKPTKPGWWFGTSILFFHLWGIIIPTD
jgi:hypothetical protein